MRTQAEVNFYKRWHRTNLRREDSGLKRLTRSEYIAATGDYVGRVMQVKRIAVVVEGIGREGFLAAMAKVKESQGDRFSWLYGESSAPPPTGPVARAYVRNPK